MQLSNLDFFFLFSASFVVTSLFTPVVKRFAIQMGITDKPIQNHKTHTTPVPYLGGLAIVLGTVAVIFISALLTDFTKQSFYLASTILVPAVLMSIVGLVDDIKQLGPWPRFLAQNLLALVAVSILITTDTIGVPFGNILIDFVLTMLWLVGITNSINFFDNIDGGASGTIAISSSVLAAIAIFNGQILIAAMSIVLAGSTIGFLVWNKAPARIYMGDAGALFLGILIASLTIRIDSSDELGELGLVIPILLLAIPILDTSVAVIKRVRRGVSPFQGGRDHLSHRLIRLGLKKRIAVLVLWIGSGVFSLAALSISIINIHGIAHIVVLVAGIAWILLLFFFLITKDED